MKTLILSTINLALVILLGSCQHSVSPDPFPVAQATDYDVYSAVIAADCRYQQPNRTLYFIDNQTIKPDSFFRRYISGLSRQDSIGADPAWQQFINTVDSSQFATYSLHNSFATTCYQIQLLTAEQRATYFSPGATKSLLDLQKEFVNFSAVLRFSSVVYSTDGTKAVCYRASYCGFDCAEGDAYLIERKPEGWKVVKRVGIWIT